MEVSNNVTNTNKTHVIKKVVRTKQVSLRRLFEQNSCHQDG